MDLVVSLVVLSVLIAIKIGGVWAAARAFGPKLFPAVRPSPLRVALLRFALGLVGSGVALAVGAALSNMLMSANRAATGAKSGKQVTAIAVAEKRARIFDETLARFVARLEKLKAAKEGDSNVLDNSMIVYGTGLSDGLMCMPGTHAKWLRLREGVVDAFGTWFTGELYELLGSHGSLAKAFGEAAPLDEAAFESGVARSLEPGADARWLHELFTFRSRVVGQGSPGAAERSRLSGWLLGTELRQALSGPFGAPDSDRTLPLVLVADPRLAGLYERTLPAVLAVLEPARQERLPRAFVRADSDCAARGLHRIATGA